MGGCVSLSLSPNSGADGGAPLAHVISLNGDLLEFPVPVTVSEVLEKQQNNPPKSDRCFLCNSDRLNFDEFISPLKKEYQLQAGQIYFMLHESKLHYKLSATDMAALAVKASVALQTTFATSSSSASASALSCCSPRRKNNKKARISPIMLDIQQQEVDYSENDHISPSKIGGFSGNGVSRSGSMRKLQRLSSKRAKLAVRSFRLKLSTIYEGTVLQSH
ncbi:hypothetical protein LIER_43168 [Lithospermum erythrorhizon]|uniref:Uncharacterized protein n=1 Tax=Lithospermum erythrorhizon TaxID=34254 RepID=A0AAV3PNA5_LITER